MHWFSMLGLLFIHLFYQTYNCYIIAILSLYEYASYLFTKAAYCVGKNDTLQGHEEKLMKFLNTSRIYIFSISSDLPKKYLNLI